MKLHKGLWLLFFLTALSVVAEVRVALIPLDEAMRSQADLVLAELSAEQDIAFLERAEYAKIQREIQLAALTDFIPDPRLMENTQLFILLKDRQMLCFDSRTGVRLLDKRVANDADAVRFVRMAVQKQRGFSAGSLRRISCMPLVPANLTREQSERAHQLEETMLRQLASASDRALLERKYLMFLLEEPNAASAKLTEELFAGSIVIKPIASPVPSGKGIRLTMEFYSPEGKRRLDTTTAEVPPNADLEAFSEAFLAKVKLPDVPADDKSAEARSFIQEAWFATRHSLTDDAISSAAAATALDDTYEKELCRIAASLALRLLSRMEPKGVQVGIKNLKVALAIAERQKIFPIELELAFKSLHSYDSWEFQRCIGDNSAEIKSIVERGFACFQQSRKDLREQYQLPCKNEIQEILALETRSYYLYDLLRYVKIQWDCTLWNRHAYPELEAYLQTYDRLIPAIEAFQKRSRVERSDLLRKDPENRKRRTRLAAAFVEFHPRSISSAFSGFSLQEIGSNVPEMDDEMVKSRLSTCRLLCSSKDVSIAMTGRCNQFMLENNVEGNGARNDKQVMEACKKCVRDIEEIIRTRTLVRNSQQDFGALHLCFLRNPLSVEERIRLSDVAFERYGYVDLWGGSLVNGYQSWSRETARHAYDKLLKWERKAQTNTMLRRQRISLENHFNFTPDGDCKRGVMQTVTFGDITYPFKDVQVNYHSAVLGSAEGTLYAIYNSHEGSTVLAALNVETGVVSTLRTYPGGYGNRVGGGGSGGGMADDYYYALDGTLCHVFPKALDKPREIVDFSQYSPEGASASAGIATLGNKLFISFCDVYNINKPGNLIEYNLDTKETKVIASTIDRTVKWPLQACETSLPILLKGRAHSQKSILLLLADKDYDNTSNRYAMRLWSYSPDTGAWQAISQLLPTDYMGCPIFRAEDGHYWLATKYGLGPINDKGEMQPQVVLGSYDRISTRFPNFNGGFNKVPIDYSMLAIKPEPKYENIEHWDIEFSLYAGKGRFFSRKCMYDTNVKEIKRLPMEMILIGAIDDMYLLAYVGGYRLQNLAIIRLEQ